MGRVSLVLAVLLAWSTTGVPAQSRASYRLTEATLNAGDHPAQRSVLASGRFRIRLDAIGEAALPIEPGTLLVAGPLAGHAMVTTNAPSGTAVGKAMTDSTAGRAPSGSCCPRGDATAVPHPPRTGPGAPFHDSSIVRVLVPPTLNPRRRRA